MGHETQTVCPNPSTAVKEGQLGHSLGQRVNTHVYRVVFHLTVILDHTVVHHGHAQWLAVHVPACQPHAESAVFPAHVHRHSLLLPVWQFHREDIPVLPHKFRLVRFSCYGSHLYHSPSSMNHFATSHFPAVTVIQEQRSVQMRSV